MKWNDKTGIESYKKSELKLYCKRSNFDINLFIGINKILAEEGFDNWHLREKHAVPEIMKLLAKYKQQGGVIKEDV